MHLVSESAQDTQAIAATFAQKILAQMPAHHGATIVALRGELGAGKTTFTQGFAKALGVHEQPKSPTFNLVKTYPIPGTPFTLWHLDCYRLNGHEDVANLGLHSAFADAHNLMLVEWPERIGNGLPQHHLEVHMKHELDPEKRAIILP